MSEIKSLFILFYFLPPTRAGLWGLHRTYRARSANRIWTGVSNQINCLSGSKLLEFDRTNAGGRLCYNAIQTRLSREEIQADGSCVCPRGRDCSLLFGWAPFIKPPQNASKAPPVVLPLHHLPRQLSQTMSSPSQSGNPYAPNLPSDVIWLEHASFAGNNIGEIFYGAYLIHH